MIRIFNTKINTEIVIDDSLDWVQVTPYVHLIPQHIKIELNGFYLYNHASKCKDCESFIKCFGKDNNDWFLEYNSRKYKINTKDIGGKEFGANYIKQTFFSEYDNGTFLTLSVMELDITELNVLLKNAENEEQYESCAIYRDLIKEAIN